MHLKILALLFSGLSVSAVSFAQSIDFKAEGKVHIRDSEDGRFPVNFPDGAAHETVDEGTHVELSNIALLWDIELGRHFSIDLKIDAIDLYEKNPTSSDLDISLDRFILRYGSKSAFPQFDSKINAYAQLGKFGKFERQEDRHLESYGLISTAFNRLEDSGLEVGIDFNAGAYAKLSYTSGNPVFFRDPNALAGDNGVRQPKYQPGLLVLYDAEVETFDLSDAPETGAALGYRWVSPGQGQRLNVMLFAYQRDLQDSQDLYGTFYGADLDFFEFSELFTPGPIDPNNDLASVPLKNEEKSEQGLNLWWYGEKLSVFFQAVRQSVGGLDRSGEEIEIAYSMKTNALSWLRRFEPVVRYSSLQNDFTTPRDFPSPSITWDWRKIDMGVNLHFSRLSVLTFEYAINQFEVRGVSHDQGEFLATYTLRYD